MVWQAHSGEHLGTLSGHTDMIYSVTFNAEGLLASGSFDCTVKLWKIGQRAGAAQHQTARYQEESSEGETDFPCLA